MHSRAILTSTTTRQSPIFMRTVYGDVAKALPGATDDKGSGNGKGSGKGRGRKGTGKRHQSSGGGDWGGDFPAVAGARGGPKRAVLAAAERRKRPRKSVASNDAALAPARK